MSLRAETLSEASIALGRVTEAEPKHFGVFIDESTFNRFPCDVCDFGGLVEDHNHALTEVVQAGKSLGIRFRPRNLVGAPGSLVLLSHGSNRRGAQRPPISIQRHARPT